jgi:hypothetical protein
MPVLPATSSQDTTMPEDPANPAPPRELSIDEKATHDAIDAQAAALAADLADAGLDDLAENVAGLRDVLRAAILAR